MKELKHDRTRLNTTFQGLQKSIFTGYTLNFISFSFKYDHYKTWPERDFFSENVEQPHAEWQ